MTFYIQKIRIWLIWTYMCCIVRSGQYGVAVGVIAVVTISDSWA